MKCCVLSILCPLEINSIDGLQGEHLEFSSSETKNIISPLPQCLWPPWWSVTQKSHDSLITWSCDIMWQACLWSLGHYGRMVTYLEGILTIKSHNARIMWFYKLKWQTNIIISTLPECLWHQTGQNVDILSDAPNHKAIRCCVHMALQGYVTNKNHSTTRVPMATNLAEWWLTLMSS